MRTMILSLALGLVLAPVAALAATTPTAAQLANQDCKALRATIGATAFTQAYGGTSAAFGKCVSKLAVAARANLSSANSLCKAEQADANFAATHAGKTFDVFYGTGAQHKNAFGNCVSLKVRSSQSAVEHGWNPSRACASLRTTMTRPTFNQSFGTNANHSNAFGKCVSVVARAQSGNLVEAAQACLAESTDTGFASSHQSKTFQQYYGKNKDLSDAFGNCVLQKLQASTAQLTKSLSTAAATCKSMRRSDPTGFRVQYGSKPNAFAKCVSAHAKLK